MRPVRHPSISVSCLMLPTNCRSLALAAVIAAIPTNLVMAADPTIVATTNFGFIDTSGEVKDQHAEHAKRLKRLDATVRNALSTTDDIEVAPLACEGARCTASAVGLETLSLEARKAGANYLLIGEVRKMSTLIGGLKFAVLDLTTNKPTCDRFLSYRGDTDESWQRAAIYAASEIKTHCLPNVVTKDVQD